jgi:hypothetical protein
MIQTIMATYNARDIVQQLFPYHVRACDTVETDSPISRSIAKVKQPWGTLL